MMDHLNVISPFQTNTIVYCYDDTFYIYSSLWIEINYELLYHFYLRLALRSISENTMGERFISVWVRLHLHLKPFGIKFG